MDHDPSLCVIVPCYNYGRFLKNCVESVLTQTDVDLRLLIIDDASTDNSSKVACELAAADSRVELRIHTINQGHIATYNEGLRWSTGTYAMVLDADDILAAGSLRRARDLLDAHPELSFVYGRARVLYGDRKAPHCSDGQPKYELWQGHQWFERICRLTENCVRQPSVVVRTSVLRKAGDFRPELPHTADMELWLRLALYGDVGYIAAPTQAFYRDHPAGLHRTHFATLADHLAQVTVAFEAVFRDYANLIPNCRQLEQEVRKTLARRALDGACRNSQGGRADSSQVTKLEKLALTTYADARELSEWRRLQSGLRIGPLACRDLPILTPSGASHLVRRLKMWRAHRTGIP
jgi:glycosyltransferase involved in cell wall biosynthesis